MHERRARIGLQAVRTDVLQGRRVSNALPGNPGSQPAFDPNAPANKHLIPFFTKLDP